MKNLYFIIGLLLLLISSSIAQNKQYLFDFDYAQFGYDTTSNYLELYYSFNQNSMTVQTKDSVKFLEGILAVSIEDTLTKKSIINKQWKVDHLLTNQSDSAGKSLVGVVNFLLPAGTYQLKVEGKDAYKGGVKASSTEYITVKPFFGKKLSISDVQLASKIIQDSQNKNSIFYKNTYEIIPTPTLVFGENQPVVFYYTELYNIPQGENIALLKLNSRVFNSKGQLVSMKMRNINHAVKSRVEVGTIVVNKFPTDTYTLVESLIDSASNYGVSTAKRFYVYNPSIVVTDTSSSAGAGILSSQFAVMSEEELNDLFMKSKYIATSAEIAQFEKLKGAEAKREFLFNFWKARDTDPSTPKNEFFTKYLDRIETCNKKFGTISKPGWKTDRGRVYMMYGEPSEIERYPNQIDSKPYEIWHYNNLEGGAVFVFGDLTGFSDYVLLHSTLRGELRDDNWMRRISSF